MGKKTRRRSFYKQRIRSKKKVPLVDVAEKDSGNRDIKAVVDGDGATFWIENTVNDVAIDDVGNKGITSVVDGDGTTFWINDTADDVALDDNKITGDTRDSITLQESAATVVADNEVSGNKDSHVDVDTKETTDTYSIKSEDVEETSKSDVSIIADVDRETETKVNVKDFMCPVKCCSKSKWNIEKNLVSHLTTVHNLTLRISRRLTRNQFDTEPLDSLSISDVPYCFLCGIKPPSPTRFKDHMTSVHGLKLMYQCPFCFGKLDTVEKLNIHLKNEHNRSPSSFIASDDMQPILVHKVITWFVRVSLDTQEKYDALRILRYLKNYNCSTDAIISCSCGKWLPTFEKLIIHVGEHKSCQPECYCCRTKLPSNAVAINDHFIINKSLCKTVYNEPTSPVIQGRQPCYLTSRSHAYPSILKCHICTDKFDNCKDECTVFHLIKNHGFVKTIAERIIDTALVAPVLDDTRNLELPQCFVCEASVDEAVDFKCHLENHMDVMMLYECPFCFSSHETQSALLLHVSKYAKLIKCSRLPPAGSIMPLLFRRNSNSMLAMVPLKNANEVRALQIMRTLPIHLPQTKHNNSDTNNSKEVISNERKDLRSATNIDHVHQSNIEVRIVGHNLKPRVAKPPVYIMKPPSNEMPSHAAPSNFRPPSIIPEPLMLMSPPEPHFPPPNQSPFPTGPLPFRPPGPDLSFERNIDKNQYVCFDCHETLISATSLKNHLSSCHKIILKWPCSQCSTWHASRSFLEMHLRSDHKMKESPAAILSLGIQPNFVRGSRNQYNSIVHNFLESKTFQQALRQVGEVTGVQSDNKGHLKLHIKDNCKSKFDLSPDSVSSSHRIPSSVKGNVSDGLALCPFCKEMKSSHERLVFHLIKAHSVKKGPAVIMSEIMYSGQIPKFDLIPQSYTCRKCCKQMSDPVRIKDHSEKHGIRLRFMCPECSQLKPTTSELAVHLVQHHNADYSYAVSYTSGTEPILAKTKHGQERMFESKDTLLYFLRRTQYTNITLPENTMKRPQREYSWSPTSENSYSSDGSFINDSPWTKKPLSTEPWWRKSEERENSPNYSKTSSTFSGDKNQSGEAYKSHVRRRRGSFSPRDEKKTRKRERDVSPVYRSASRLSPPLSVHDQTGLRRLAKDTHHTYQSMNARDSDRYSHVNNKQKPIKRELLSSRADLEGMLSRTGSAVTGRVQTKKHDGKDRTRTAHYDRNLIGDGKRSMKTATHYDRDIKKTTAHFLGKVVNRDGYEVDPSRQKVRSSVDLPVTKLHSLEGGQSVIFNGKLFLVFKHVDSCLLRKA